VVKPNREELAQTIGRAIDDDRQLLGAMRSLNRRGAQWVVTTQGERPVWVTSASQTYCLHWRTVDKVVNPIGSAPLFLGLQDCETCPRRAIRSFRP